MKLGEKILWLIAADDDADGLIARDIGVAPTRISKWKDDPAKADPHYGVLLRIARKYGVSLEWLCDDAREGPPPPLEYTLGSDDVEVLRLARQYGYFNTRRMLEEAVAPGDAAADVEVTPTTPPGAGRPPGRKSS